MDQIEKTLSANDTGETGGHQAGLLIPRNPKVLAFFPKLDPALKNPRDVIDVVDEAGEDWSFNFIYYNNHRFGGTRNEYRLTGMTDFIRRHGLKTGDVVTFTRTDKRTIAVTCRRKDAVVTVSESGRKTLKLAGSWRVVESDRFA
jgi:hypothetical protein